MGINAYIDYIDDPNDTFDQYLEKARAYGFRCIFVDPETYDHACAALAGTGIIVAGAIDFPAGGLTFEEELPVFEHYAAAGFTEIDYVLNQRAVEERDFAEIEREMMGVAEFCRAHGMRDKVIVEMPKLESEQDKRRVCEIALRARPAFLKTSSGRPYKATLEDVRLMHEVLGDAVRVKAAGGIRTYEQARAFIDAGASALGATAGIAIVEGERAAEASGK